MDFTSELRQDLSKCDNSANTVDFVHIEGIWVVVVNSGPESAHVITNDTIVLLVEHLSKFVVFALFSFFVVEIGRTFLFAFLFGTFCKVQF